MWSRKQTWELKEILKPLGSQFSALQLGSAVITVTHLAGDSGLIIAFVVCRLRKQNRRASWYKSSVLNCYPSATKTFCQCTISLRGPPQQKNAFVLEGKIVEDHYGRTPTKVPKPCVLPVGKQFWNTFFLWALEDVKDTLVRKSRNSVCTPHLIMSVSPVVSKVWEGNSKMYLTISEYSNVAAPSCLDVKYNT